MKESIMPDLKLAKLPDRTPVKITVTVGPDLNRNLHAYAELYRETYGAAESVAELIPYILESFLGSDRSFAKARKEGAVSERPAAPRFARPGRTRRGDSPSSSSTAS
jgi:hypothetical protein